MKYNTRNNTLGSHLSQNDIDNTYKLTASDLNTHNTIDNNCKNINIGGNTKNKTHRVQFNQNDKKGQYNQKIFEGSPSYKYTVPTSHSEFTFKQEQQRVEIQILIQEKRLQELQLQQKKNILATKNKKTQQIELEMLGNSSYEIPMQQNLLLHAGETSYNDRYREHTLNKNFNCALGFSKNLNS